MRARRLVAAALGAGALLLAVPGTASAHPLGNFTVNHHDHVQLTTAGVTVTSVVDRAEIPAAQALQSIAPDGSPSAGQLADAAVGECADVASAVRVQVDGDTLGWTVATSGMESVPGAAGLPTLRLTCTFTAEADLDGARTVRVENDHLGDRVGWREMTAAGDGVRLIDSPVPAESITDGLRDYPVDLLASPLDVRSFAVATEPGASTGTGAGSVTPVSGDPVSDAMAALDRRLQSLVGDAALTPLVGTLAVLLAVLLGCGHALLPGHGKTVMAAYLAGRAGRPRDALTVGATVTATHTVGVLVLGLALSVSSSLAGDQVLRWLGVVSGLLVAAIGVAMLREALPRWRAARARRAHEHAHAHGHEHSHDQAHDQAHDHGQAPRRELVTVAATDHAGGHPRDHVHPHRADHGHGRLPGHDHDASAEHEHGHGDGADHDHDAEHGHGHDHLHPHEHGEGHGHGAGNRGRLGTWFSGAGHSHGPGGHTHGPGGHTHGPADHAHDAPIGRRGLVGMGIAGGLVPSPSALIVLIASVGLGRTVFGVVLVLAYGLGMAGTLTAVGLLLVRLRDRMEARVAGLRRDRVLGLVTRVAPLVTASLVLLVGLTLVVRGALVA